MIGKDELTVNCEATRVKIISEQTKSLDESVEKVRTEVTNCFQDIINSLKTREKQLLRQIDAVHNQQLSIVQSNWELVCSVPSIAINLAAECNDFKKLIDKFGKIELSDNDSIVVKDAEPYRVEDYEDASKDHISFDKSIKVIERNNDDVNDDDDEIELCDSPNSDKKYLKSKNIDTTPINSFASSSSNDSSFNTSLEQMTNNLYLDSSIQQKMITETRNNNYSPLCSPLINVNSGSTEYKSQRLDISNNSGSNLCSNKINMNDSTNGIDNSKIEISTDTVEKMSNDDMFLNTKDIVNFNKSIECTNNNEKHGNEEHPKQIQEWLQQILVETETEPSIQEIEQFAEISKSRYRGFEFSLET